MNGSKFGYLFAPGKVVVYDRRSGRELGTVSRVRLQRYDFYSKFAYVVNGVRYRRLATAAAALAGGGV